MSRQSRGWSGQTWKDQEWDSNEWTSRWGESNWQNREQCHDEAAREYHNERSWSSLAESAPDSSSGNWRENRWGNSTDRSHQSAEVVEVVEVVDSQQGVSTPSSSSSSSSSSPPRGQTPEYKVAIPSYDRVGVLKEKTLDLLIKRGGLDPSHIYVFADPRQVNPYKEALKDSGVTVVEGKKGICEQRNFIASYFSPGTNITEIDDDIADILCLQEPPLTARIPCGMKELLDAIWSLSEANGIELWGISTSSNGKFMKATVTVGVVKCTGQLMGYKASSFATTKLTVPVMEDLQRCFAYARTGKTCARFNFLAVKTINRGKGGCDSAFVLDAKECTVGEGEKKEYWKPRALKEKEAAHELQRQYGDYVLLQEPKAKTLQYCAIDDRQVPVYHAGHTLRMKKIQLLPGTSHKPLRELRLYQRLKSCCGITSICDAQDVEEDLIADRDTVDLTSEDTCQFSSDLLRSLTIAVLKDKISKMGLQEKIKEKLAKSASKNLVKSDYVDILHDHELQQIKNQLSEARRNEELAEQRQRKAEEELAITQKKAKEAIAKAQSEKEALKAKAEAESVHLKKKAKEYVAREKEAAKAAALAETVEIKRKADEELARAQEEAKAAAEAEVKKNAAIARQQFLQSERARLESDLAVEKLKQQLENEKAERDRVEAIRLKAQAARKMREEEETRVAAIRKGLSKVLHFREDELATESASTANIAAPSGQVEVPKPSRKEARVRSRSRSTRREMDGPRPSTAPERSRSPRREPALPKVVDESHFRLFWVDDVLNVYAQDNKSTLLQNAAPTLDSTGANKTKNDVIHAWWSDRDNDVPELAMVLRRLEEILRTGSGDWPNCNAAILQHEGVAAVGHATNKKSVEQACRLSLAIALTVARGGTDSGDGFGRLCRAAAQAK